MVRIQILILMFFLLFFFEACVPLLFGNFLDTKLTIQKQEYNGNELRIDGYYYSELNNKYDNVFFFYLNGVLLDGSDGYKDRKEYEKKITSKEWINCYRFHKFCWGLYQIDDNIIRIEKWLPSSGGGSPAGAYLGEIINDTTFVIKKYMDIGMYKNEPRILEELYHFRHFSPKPDSTNSFIK